MNQEKTREYNERYRLIHKEEILEYQRKWYARNRERILECARRKKWKRTGSKFPYWKLTYFKYRGKYRAKFWYSSSEMVAGTGTFRLEDEVNYLSNLEITVEDIKDRINKEKLIIEILA